MLLVLLCEYYTLGQPKNFGPKGPNPNFGQKVRTHHDTKPLKMAMLRLFGVDGQVQINPCIVVVKYAARRLKFSVHSPFGPRFPEEFEAFIQKQVKLRFYKCLPQ